MLFKFEMKSNWFRLSVGEVFGMGLCTGSHAHTQQQQRKTYGRMKVAAAAAKPLHSFVSFSFSLLFMLFHFSAVVAVLAILFLSFCNERGRVSGIYSILFERAS